MINTLNESSLHKTLKKLYSLETNSLTEVAKDGVIYDIQKQDGTIIEIQTQNLSKLAAKIEKLLLNGKKIKVVHPVSSIKYIEVFDKNGTRISRRKSPKKNGIYSIIKELTGIYPFLLDKNFILEIPLVSITEKRIKTEKPVQTINKRRRFKKDWIKTDKSLNEIIETKIFSTAQDYLSFLPQNLPKEFSAKDLKESLIKNCSIQKDAWKFAHLIIWVFSRMELIEQTGIKEKSRIFRIKK